MFLISQTRIPIPGERSSSENKVISLAKSFQ